MQIWATKESAYPPRSIGLRYYMKKLYIYVYRLIYSRNYYRALKK